MNPVRSDRKRKLLIMGAATLAILLGGEATLRLWDSVFRLPYRHFDPQLKMFRLVPSFSAGVNGMVLRINSRGFRAREFTREKPSDVFRIIMLGDSVTFGLFGEDCDYPGILQRLFDAEGPGRVEVINTAVEGYDSSDALRLLDRELLDYSPDLVTVLIGWNDLLKRDPARPAASDFEKRAAYAIYDVYLVRFWRKVVYFYLRHALLRPETPLSPEEEEQMRGYSPLVYKEHLQKIVSTARRGRSDVVLFTLPSLLRPDIGPEDVRKLHFPHFTYNLRKFLLLYERYNEALRDIGRLNGVPVIELQEPLRGHESRLFMDTAHLECEGQRILSEYLHGTLSDLIRRRLGQPGLNGR
jgi:GDSL-like lipase/acylhydrolase family protein